jgi:hypothetical protein
LSLLKGSVTVSAFAAVATIAMNAKAAFEETNMVKFVWMLL